MRQKGVLFFALLLEATTGNGQVEYPYPLQKLYFNTEGKKSYMVYMDVQPVNGNGQTIILDPCTGLQKSE